MPKTRRPPIVGYVIDRWTAILTLKRGRLVAGDDDLTLFTSRAEAAEAIRKECKAANYAIASDHYEIRTLRRARS